MGENRHKAGEFAVIGLGRFGAALARNLAKEGCSVLAIDANEDKVQKLANEIDTILCADSTDEQVLEEMRIADRSCVIVAIGDEAIEASILTTAILRKLGVPRIIGRAANDLHARVLQSVGAHQVINPEGEMGERLGKRLVRPNLLEQVDLGGNTDLAELTLPEAWVGRTLEQLELRKRHNISVIAIKRGTSVITNPAAAQQLASGDVLVVLGSPADIRRIASLV